MFRAGLHLRKPVLRLYIRALYIHACMFACRRISHERTNTRVTGSIVIRVVVVHFFDYEQACMTSPVTSNELESHWLGTNDSPQIPQSAISFKVRLTLIRRTKLNRRHPSHHLLSHSAALFFCLPLHHPIFKTRNLFWSAFKTKWTPVEPSKGSFFKRNN